MTLDALHQQIKDAFESSKPDSVIEFLMSQCDDGECHICGQIVCPHKEWLHFHHDGCPSCTEPHEPYTQEQVDMMNAAEED